MKRSTKILLAVAAVLVLSGGVMFTVVMSANNWDLAVFDSFKYTSYTLPVDEDFENISVGASEGNVSFFPSDDGKCRVFFCHSVKVFHELSVRNNTLYVSAKDVREWYDRISVTSKTPEIAVYLPKAAYLSLSAKGEMSNVIIAEDLIFESIDISVETGNVDCHASSSGEIRIDSGTGNIHIEKLSAESIDLSASSGDVYVRSVDCRGNIDISEDTGEAVLSNVSCAGLSSAADTGRITMKDVTVSGSLLLTRNTGDVTFERCDASEISIETNTGDVTGTLLSEKVFVTHSDNGSISVPETYSGGKCKITTDTGDISVSIENKSPESRSSVVSE